MNLHTIRPVSIGSITLAVVAVLAYTIQCFCPAAPVDVVVMSCHAEASTSCCCSTAVDQNPLADEGPLFVGSASVVPNGPALSSAPECVNLRAPSKSVFPGSNFVFHPSVGSPLYLSHQVFRI